MRYQESSIPKCLLEKNGRLHLVARSIVYMTIFGNKLKGFLELIERNLRGLRPHIF